MMMHNVHTDRLKTKATTNTNVTQQGVEHVKR